MHERAPTLPPDLGWDLTDPARALTSFLGTLPARPDLLALGEPTHGVEEFLEWRNRLFRALAEEHGYRSIALESDLLAGLEVNAYVTGGSGNLDDVLKRGFSHGFGLLEGNWELLAWLREFNAGRAEHEQLRFYGFDAPLEYWAPSPRASLLALHAFLSANLEQVPIDAATIEGLCDEDAPWSNPASVMDPARSIGGSERARQLRLLADDLSTLLQTEMPQLAQAPGFWEAQAQARTATGLLRYHALLADPSPKRIARAAALRALMMAENLEAIREREAPRGPTLVFAHNTHLQRMASAMRFGETRVQWWGAGALIAARLGPRYAFITAALGSGAGQPDPAPDTLDGVLMTSEGPARLFATADLLPQLPESLTKRHDPAKYPVYFPLKCEELPHTDGVLFVRTASTERAQRAREALRAQATQG